MVFRHRVELAGGELLQDRLVVAVTLAPRVRLHQRPEQPFEQPASLVEPEVQVHGPEDGLEGVGEDARLVPPSAQLLALAEPHQRAEPERPRDLGERLRVHDRGTELGELSLGQVGEGGEGHVGDDEAEDRVTEELEPFVRGVQTVFEGVRTMRERGLTQTPVHERMPRAASRASGPGSDDVSVWVTPSLDLDGLPARVVPAVPADAVGQLRLMALWAFRVRGRRLPVRGALVTRVLLCFFLGLPSPHPFRCSGIGSCVRPGVGPGFVSIAAPRIAPDGSRRCGRRRTPSDAVPRTARGDPPSGGRCRAPYRCTHRG